MTMTKLLKKKKLFGAAGISLGSTGAKGFEEQGDRFGSTIIVATDDTGDFNSIEEATAELPAGGGKIIIKEVTVDYNKPSDDSHILINKSSYSQDYDCSDAPSVSACRQYIDLEEKVVTWPMTLPAHSSKIIIWTNNPFKDNIKPFPPSNLDLKQAIIF